MDTHHLRFTLVVSVAHGLQHFFKRLIPPLIPILVVSLGFPLWKLGLLVSMFSIGSGLGQTPLGILSDRYDRRYLLPTGIGVIALGYVFLVLAPMIGTVIPVVEVFDQRFTGPFIVMLFSMLLSGTGASAVHPTGYPLISSNLPPDSKGQALGVWGGMAKFGDAAAPLVIGILILFMVWDQILLLLGLLGVLLSLVLFVLLGPYETKPPANEETADDETDESTGFGWLENKHLYLYPMLAVFVFFLMRMFVGAGVNTFIPEFISSVYSYSLSGFGFEFTPESTANLYFSVLLITAGIVQIGAGRLVDIFDYRMVMIGCQVLTTIALVIVSVFHLSPLLLLVALVLVGAGHWGSNPARDALVSEISPPEREGRSFGYLWTGAFLFGSAGPPVVGYIGDTSSLQTGFLLLAVAAFIAILPIAAMYSDRIYARTDDAKPVTPSD